MVAKVINHDIILGIRFVRPIRLFTPTIETFRRPLRGKILAGSLVRLIRKYLFERHVKDKRDAKSQFQGGGVFALFHRNDRLASHANLFRQLLLGHFIMIESQSTDVRVDPSLAHLRNLFDTKPVLIDQQRSGQQRLRR